MSNDTVKKSHVDCEMTWICVYKVDAIITLQADFLLRRGYDFLKSKICLFLIKHKEISE
jgi:hypothetical protein